MARLEKQQAQILTELRQLKKTLLVQKDPDAEITVEDIGKIRERLNKLQSQLDNQQEILGFKDSSVSASPTQTLPNTDFVFLSNRKWGKVDVFQNPNNSSKIVGQAVYGKNYLYTEKKNGYYYIRLDNNLWGWIHYQFVNEY